MRVLGWYYHTKIYGERWRIDSDNEGGYRALEVQEAKAITHTPRSNRVIIRSNFVEYDIRHKDSSALTDEQANTLVRNLAEKRLVDLDQYDMALFEEEKVSIPVENETQYGIPFEVKIVKDDDEDDEHGEDGE